MESQVTLPEQTNECVPASEPWADIPISEQEINGVLHNALFRKYLCQPERVEIDAMHKLKATAWMSVVEPLTDEEAKEVLDELRFTKYQAMQSSRLRNEAFRRMEANVSQPWNADQLSEFLLTHVAHIQRLRYRDGQGKKVAGFQIDKDNEHVFRALCCYFTGDEDGFCEIGAKHFVSGEIPFGATWDIDKGIYLYGPVGTGKSTIMRLFRANKRQSFDAMACSDIADAYSKLGTPAVQQFYTAKPLPTADYHWFCQRQLGVCFDDLGTEATAGFYANRKNVMADIIQARYREWEKGKMDFNMTHITSNLDADAVENKYGDRVRSRMRQMVNVIELIGKDRRS